MSETELVELYPILYRIRYILGFLGGLLIVSALKWWNQLPFKTNILMLISGITLVILTFALKHEYLKRRKLLGDL